MKVALAILCFGGVAFLLHVLVAFAAEGKRLPARNLRVHFAKFSPKLRRGELVEIRLWDQKRNVPTATDQWPNDFGDTTPRAG